MDDVEQARRLEGKAAGYLDTELAAELRRTLGRLAEAAHPRTGNTDRYIELADWRSALEREVENRTEDKRRRT